VLRTIILAAGASSRMGRPKPALPIGRTGDTFLSRIITTMLAAELPEIIVVTGATPDTTRAAGPRRDARVRFVQNDAWQSGQLSSLVVGLEVPSVVPIEAAVVTLVDIPMVAVETVTTLVRTWRETRAPIVRPARGDEHGHPVIFDTAIFGELRNADPATGAKPVVRAHTAEIVNVPIDDPGAYLDVDTPEQYSSMT
jgi:molybdenum cofactor cytidylyltransferase